MKENFLPDRAEEYFDACLIAMVPLRNDARTLNIARTLVNTGKKIVIIAFGESSEKSEFLKEKIFFFPIEKKKNFPRMISEWRYFYSQAKKIIPAVKSRSYWAEDIYSLPVAKKFSSRFGGKIFYDSREIYSTLASLGNRPVAQKILSSIEKYYIRSVDEIFVSGKLDADYLAKYFGWKKKIHVVMNLPPYKEKISSNILRKKFSIPIGKKILLYQGMLSEGRGIMPSVHALQYLDDCVLCLLGDGGLKEKILSEAKKISVEKKIFLGGNIPYDELHAWTSSADLGLCLIEPVSFSYELALPNKIFEYTMARIPTLATDLPALRNFIEEFPVGALIPPDASPEMIAEKISIVLGEKEKFSSVCESAAFVYSREGQEQKILSLAAEI